MAHKDTEVNKEYCKNYHQENKEKIAARKRAYYKANKERIAAYGKEYFKTRYHEDPQYRLANLLRTRISHLLNGQTKSKKTEALLGCSYEECVKHIETRFKQGMTWENHGEWHIDHIIPLAAYDLTDPAQLEKACHYTNLSPLWAKENQTKGKTR